MIHARHYAFSVVLAAMAIAPTVAGSEPPRATILRAEQFGARGDGRSDDGISIAKMFAAARRIATPVRLQFRAGRTYFLKTGVDRYAFSIDGARDMTIDGGGALFLVDSHQRFLKVVRSQNITVRNLKVDYVPLPFADGTIVAKSRAAGTLDVKIDAGESLPPPGGPTHADGEQAYFAALWYPGVYSDQGDGGAYWVRVNFDIREVRAIAAGRVVQLQSTPNDPLLDAITPGRWRCSVPVRGIAHCYGPGETFQLRDNRDLTLENIDLWSAPWFAYGLTGNRGRVVLRNVNVRPRPGTPRNASSWRDGFHAKNNRASLLFEGCTVQGTGDDAFNIASHTSTVREIVSPRRVRISQNFPLGVAAMESGDVLVFYSPRKGAILGRAHIVRADPPDGNLARAPLFTLDLDAPVEGLEAGKTLAWNEQSSNPNTTLRRCRMDTSCRFRSPVTIDSCRINALAWFTGDEIETPIPSRVTVRGSQLRLGQGNPSIVMAMGGPFLEGHGPQEPVIDHVVFDHNRIWGDFLLNDASDVVLTENDFAASDRTVLLKNVRHIRLHGNTRAGKPYPAIEPPR